MRGETGALGALLAGIIALVASGQLAAAAWAQGLPSARPEEVGLSAERLGRIGQVLQAEISQKKMPGAVALVARKGRTAYLEAFGARDPAAGTPMSRDAIFRIYSMTKPFASVAAMMVAEEGRIVLTDPVSKYLPALGKPQVSLATIDPVYGKVTYTSVPAEQEMTVQDLLRHTSGLVYGDRTANTPVKEAYTKAGLYQPATQSSDVWHLTPAEQLEAFARVPLAQQPGRVWEYGLSTDLLGRVVEAASGMRLGEFLEARVFKPLRMADSGFSVPPDKLERLAQPFARDPATNNPIRLIDVSAPPKNDSGGAGAVSTASDYLRFAQMLLNGGQLDGTRLLSRTTVDLMTSDHLGKILEAGTTPGELLLGTKGYTFGLGFAVRREAGLAGTPGSAGDFMWGGFAGTYFWVDPKEELVGILMTQQPGPLRVYYRKLFRQLVYQAIADEPEVRVSGAR
jgi:CubicO group peptidase (beta-lactamase class C family)